jgi:hypothetical protein
MKKLVVGVVVSSLFVVTAYCSAFTAGDLVVVTVGSGASINSSATAAALYEFTTSGGLVQQIALPTAASGGNGALTLSGSASSEGFLQISANGQYLTMAGYNAAPGTAAPQTALASAVNRVVGVIDMSGNINTTTILNNSYSGSNIRGAVSTDGNNLWLSGNGGSSLGGTAGIQYTTTGGSASTQINPTTTNVRVVNIYNNQLYGTSASGSGTPWLGVATVGTGLPTTTQVAPGYAILPGMPTTGTHSSYDFWFKDANTVYVADDTSAANNGGIQKWTQSGGTWTLSYTLLNTGTSTTAARGLAGTVDGSGNTLLFFTTGSLLGEVIDTGVNTSTFTTLATAASGYAFRGVEFLPVPEPGSFAILGLGLLSFALFRRFRR